MVVHFYFSTDLLLSFYHSCFSLSVNLGVGVGDDVSMIGVRGQPLSQVSIENFITLFIMTVRTCLYQILFLGQPLILLSVAQHDSSIKHVGHLLQLWPYSEHLL